MDISPTKVIDRTCGNAFIYATLGVTPLLADCALLL